MTAESYAEAVLVAHQRHRGGCLCGWSELGRSHPAHQVAMLRGAGLLGTAAEGLSAEKEGRDA